MYELTLCAYNFVRPQIDLSNIIEDLFAMCKQ